MTSGNAAPVSAATSAARGAEGTVWNRPWPSPRADTPPSGVETCRSGRPSSFRSPARSTGGEEKSGTWSIVIVAASGDEADGLAGAALNKVRVQGGLPDAYMERRGNSVVVAYGRYAGPSDAQAQRDLERIQGIVVDGAKPFEGAVLVPPPFAGVAGGMPEYNLANVKRTRGKDALYSLQIAVYTVPPPNVPKPNELAEFRKKAEEAVVNLRREGEEAFYYHGPNASMVTVGVFGPKDLDVTRPERQSFALMEARRKYPFNLVNGAQYLVKTKTQTRTAQPSFVVPIPD